MIKNTTFSTFNMMDNFLLSIFFFFQPFNYALTLKLGFPLKISEIVLFIYLSLLILRPKLRILIGRSDMFAFITCFVGVVFISCVTNLFWEYEYSFNEYVSRFGYKYDSLLKFFYLLLSYFAFIIASNAFSANQDRYCNALFSGTLLAAIYCWYLFTSTSLNLDPFLLPGMDEEPHAMIFIGRSIIRCGTMKEGNYMGLFLFMMAVLAMYKKRNKLSTFFFLTIITTLSTMAMGCSFLFLLIYMIKRYFINATFFTFLKYFSVLASILVILLSFEQFRLILIDKLVVDSNDVHIDNAALSKSDRLNSVQAAYDLGMDNPVLGVGLSNYALHYIEYYPDLRMFYPGFKNIINNVYAEIFAETGAIALVFFLLFLFCLFRSSLFDNQGVVVWGFLLTLVYFLTYPSFTVQYVWVFWGFIASLRYLDEQEVTH